METAVIFSPQGWSGGLSLLLALLTRVCARGCWGMHGFELCSPCLAASLKMYGNPQQAFFAHLSASMS